MPGPGWLQYIVFLQFIRLNCIFTLESYIVEVFPSLVYVDVWVKLQVLTMFWCDIICTPADKQQKKISCLYKSDCPNTLDTTFKLINLVLTAL